MFETNDSLPEIKFIMSNGIYVERNIKRVCMNILHCKIQYFSAKDNSTLDCICIRRLYLNYPRLTL